MNQFLNAVDMSLASKGKRFVNFIVDYILYYIIFQIIFTIILLTFVQGYQNFVINNNLSTTMISIFILLLNNLFYMMFMSFQEYLLKGRTIGKYLTGTKVVKEDGSIPEMKDYFIRSLCRLIPFEAFSFLGETGWHDSISKTRVVNNSEYMLNQVKFNEINQIGELAE
jgi:uncharacterized RDD family membrane protein YckC